MLTVGSMPTPALKSLPALKDWQLFLGLFVLSFLVGYFGLSLALR